LTTYTEEIKSIINIHPAAFTEIYEERYVNNIYLDSANFSCFWENLNGNTDRTKYRVRWYGSQYKNDLEATLELKIKKGLLGDKMLLKLNPFDFSSSYEWNGIKAQIFSSLENIGIREKIWSMSPKLFNRYKRSYYISDDNKYRLTIDSEMTYFPISILNASLTESYEDTRNVVVEIKYDETDTAVDEISKFIPYRITKNSKYVTGILKTNYLEGKY
jgi:SPX domain protein involved in polyphosphate accumulation